MGSKFCEKYAHVLGEIKKETKGKGKKKEEIFYTFCRVCGEKLYLEQLELEEKEKVKKEKKDLELAGKRKHVDAMSEDELEKSVRNTRYELRCNLCKGKLVKVLPEVSLPNGMILYECETCKEREYKQVKKNG